MNLPQNDMHVNLFHAESLSVALSTQAGIVEELPMGGKKGYFINHTFLLKNIV